MFGGNPFWDDEFLIGVGDYYYHIDRQTGNAFLGGQGFAVGDVDGDGLDDLYVAQQGGLPNRLFAHRPDGTAVDVAHQAGVDMTDELSRLMAMERAPADLDNQLGASRIYVMPLSTEK